MQHQVAGKQPNSKMCFVCGLKNQYGLKARFYETEKLELIACFTPNDEHQSYPGRMHGGIASAVLDETIGRAVMIGKEKEVWGVTVELQTRFRKPIPLGEEIKVVGRVTNETNRIFEGTGEIILADGTVAVTASGRYLKMPLDKISDFDAVDNEWRSIVEEQDPVYIEIGGKN